MNEKYRKIVHALIESGLTQNDLALAAGIHQSTISRLSTGETEYPSVPAANALEKLYEETIKAA